MSFVKLDTGILDSTLWLNRDERDIFVTALLMAEPYEVAHPVEQIAADSLERTGFVVPAGWYGFIRAAGPGIVRRALVAAEDGIAALVRLGSPDPESRTPDHDGRRLVRVDGGYLVLNFMRYRDRDETAASRMRRYRENKRIGCGNSEPTARVTRNAVDVTASPLPAEREAEADAYVKAEKPKLSAQHAARFEDFWAVYPKKVGKKPALVKWQSRKLDAIADRLISDVLNRAANDDGWLRGFVPDPLTYLNQDRWHDDLRTAPVARAGPAVPQTESKTLTGMKALQGMKNGLVHERDYRRADEAAVLELGPGACRRLGSDHGRDVD